MAPRCIATRIQSRQATADAGKHQRGSEGLEGGRCHSCMRSAPMGGADHQLATSLQNFGPRRVDEGTKVRVSTPRRHRKRCTAVGATAMMESDHALRQLARRFLVELCYFCRVVLQVSSVVLCGGMKQGDGKCQAKKKIEMYIRAKKRVTGHSLKRSPSYC